jgi:hypothetical protein
MPGKPGICLGFAGVPGIPGMAIVVVDCRKSPIFGDF